MLDKHHSKKRYTSKIPDINWFTDHTTFSALRKYETKSVSDERQSPIQSIPQRVSKRFEPLSEYETAVRIAGESSCSTRVARFSLSLMVTLQQYSGGSAAHEFVRKFARCFKCTNDSQSMLLASYFVV